METRKLTVIILAAGKGTRMKSVLPKVLHTLDSKPLLAYSLTLAQQLQASPTVVVVGHGAAEVQQAFVAWPDLSFVVQEPQLGTGHAVMAATSALAGFSGTVLVLNGDVPGLRLSTVQNMLEQHWNDHNQQTVLAMQLDDPAAYGRLITQDSQLLAIREFRDATPAEKEIKIVNAGIYVFEAPALLASLPLLNTNNDQNEYYLTDLVEVMHKNQLKAGYALCEDPQEVAGINSQEELQELQALWQRKSK